MRQTPPVASRVSWERVSAIGLNLLVWAVLAGVLLAQAGVLSTH